MEEAAKKTSELQIRIENAWKNMPALPKEDLVIDTWESDIKNAREYFSDRPLAQIDLSDPFITRDNVFYEAFTSDAKLYYSGKYLEYLLQTYEKYPPYQGEYAAEHFLSYLLSQNARNPKIKYSREQASVIADVLDYIAERIDPNESDGEDAILDAMYYWRDKANECGDAARS